MKFRILAFCGGGVRGLMSATILSRLNTEFKAKHGKSIAHQAHMIAGTSTGSLITGMLLIGLTPELIIDFYNDVAVPSFKKAATDPNAPALPPDSFISILDKLHLDPKLSFFEKKALFTSFDIGADGVPWTPQLFNNFEGSPTAGMRLFDAMAASGSMPGMGATYACNYGGRQLNLVDGAFVHHDPTIPAVALAAQSGVEVADMSAIDIGTGFMRNFITAETEGWGANQWINGTGSSDGTLPPLLINAAPPNQQMPIFNMCLNGTSTNLMPDMAGMLLRDRFAYLNPDFGARYVGELSTDPSDLAFLVEVANAFDIGPAMDVLDKHWVDDLP